MSKKSRYEIAKWVYPKYIILIRYRNKYITYDNDNLICHYLGFYDNKKNNKFRIFTKYQINYLVLDELDIIKQITFSHNNYEKYSYLVNLKRIVKKINNRLLNNNKLTISFEQQNNTKYNTTKLKLESK